MRLGKPAQHQQLSTRRVNPSIPTFPVRAYLFVIFHEDAQRLLQSTSRKHHGTWTRARLPLATNVDRRMTALPTSSINGTTEALLQGPPRRSIERAHAKTVVR